MDGAVRYIERRARHYSMLSRRMVLMLWHSMICTRRKRMMMRTNGLVYIVATRRHRGIVTVRRLRCRTVHLGPYCEHVLYSIDTNTPSCRGLLIQYGIHNN